MTDQQWQEQFRLMKQSVLPSIYGRLTVYSEPSSREPELSGSYDGSTNWQYYVLYINDTLSELRKGRTCYAWFPYKIQDLLRFEHRRLRTRYITIERMWALWLQESGDPAASNTR